MFSPGARGTRTSTCIHPSLSLSSLQILIHLRLKLYFDPCFSVTWPCYSGPPALPLTRRRICAHLGMDFTMDHIDDVNGRGLWHVGGMGHVRHMGGRAPAQAQRSCFSLHLLRWVLHCLPRPIDLVCICTCQACACHASSPEYLFIYFSQCPRLSHTQIMADHPCRIACRSPAVDSGQASDVELTASA